MSSSYTILHAIRSLDPALGGPVEVLKQLARAHIQMGHRVEAVTLDVPGAPWFKDFPLPVHALGEEGTGSTGYGFSPQLVPWLREQRGNYSAVISHGLWQYNNTAVRQALKGTDTPWFVFPHGMLDPVFKRVYPVKHFKKWLYWMWRERKVLRDADAVLFTCEEERLQARKSFWPYRCAERVTPLGIERPSLENAEQDRAAFLEKFPALAGKRIVLFLGRLHHKKGCDLLIEAFGKMNERGDAGSTPFHLVLAGPCASDDYAQTLRQLAETHCPPGTVSFPGMLTGAMKWGAFHAAEVFALPSHQENFGLAVAEALACRVPVLISDKVNIWREISEDQAGFVESDNLTGTAKLLERWMQMGEGERKKMRESAVKCYETRFRIENTARELLIAISEATQKN